MSNSDVIYPFFIVLLTCSIMIKFHHIFEFSSQFSHWQNFAMPPVTLLLVKLKLSLLFFRVTSVITGLG